jgi:hypothetical protein
VEHDPISGGQLALPFVVAVGLAVGESLAGALAGPELPKNNDVAGAGAAIMFVLTLAVGFIVTAVALVVQRMNGRHLPHLIALRGGASVIAGGVIGAATWSELVPVPIILAALVLVSIAIAVAWPWDDR